MATESTQPTSSTGQTEEAGAPPPEEGKGKPGEVTGGTKIANIDEFQKVAPDVYKKTLEGIGSTICKEMRQHQERLKKLMREGRQQ